MLGECWGKEEHSGRVLKRWFLLNSGQLPHWGTKSLVFAITFDFSREIRYWICMWLFLNLLLLSISFNKIIKINIEELRLIQLLKVLIQFTHSSCTTLLSITLCGICCLMIRFHAVSLISSDLEETIWSWHLQHELNKENPTLYVNYVLL